jgi:hypothetical protein
MKIRQMFVIKRAIFTRLLNLFQQKKEFIISLYSSIDIKQVLGYMSKNIILFDRFSPFFLKAVMILFSFTLVIHLADRKFRKPYHASGFW